eukprot:3015606-Rhodomonas_salina.2
MSVMLVDMDAGIQTGREHTCTDVRLREFRPSSRSRCCGSRSPCLARCARGSELSSLLVIAPRAARFIFRKKSLTFGTSLMTFEALVLALAARAALAIVRNPTCWVHVLLLLGAKSHITSGMTDRIATRSSQK